MIKSDGSAIIKQTVVTGPIPNLVITADCQSQLHVEPRIVDYESHCEPVCNQRTLHGLPIDIQSESVWSDSRGISWHFNEHFCTCACPTLFICDRSFTELFGHTFYVFMHSNEHNRLLDCLIFWFSKQEKIYFISVNSYGFLVLECHKLDKDVIFVNECMIS